MSEHWIDGAIGETREALVEDGRVIALRVVRASDEGRRARWGEVYAARVTRVDKRRRGAFVELGLAEEQGFLPLDGEGNAKRGRVAATEGARIVVEVTREGARGKNPVLRLRDDPHPGGECVRLDRHESDDALEEAGPADSATVAKIDAAIEDALARTAPIAGGGALTIEPTAALVAIDVDAGARAGSGDAEKFALDLNLAALEAAARQLRLRALGGIVAIDFVSMRKQQSRTALMDAAKRAFARDPWGVRAAPLSRFGVMELTRGQLQRPLHEIMLDVDGKLSAESRALAALRAVEREGRASAGRRIAATIDPDAMAWLEGSPLGWRAALTNRIGPRFTLEAGAVRGGADVRAL